MSNIAAGLADVGDLSARFAQAVRHLQDAEAESEVLTAMTDLEESVKQPQNDPGSWKTQVAAKTKQLGDWLSKADISEAGRSRSQQTLQHWGNRIAIFGRTQDVKQRDARLLTNYQKLVEHGQKTENWTPAEELLKEIGKVQGEDTPYMMAQWQALGKAKDETWQQGLETEFHDTLKTGQHDLARQVVDDMHHLSAKQRQEKLALINADERRTSQLQDLRGQIATEPLQVQSSLGTETFAAAHPNLRPEDLDAILQETRAAIHQRSFQETDKARQFLDQTDLAKLRKDLEKPDLTLADIEGLETKHITRFLRGGLEAYLAAKQSARPLNNREAYQRAWSAILAYDPEDDTEGHQRQNFETWLSLNFTGKDRADLQSRLAEHITSPANGHRLARVFTELDDHAFQQALLGPANATRLHPLFAGLYDSAPDQAVNKIKRTLSQEAQDGDFKTQADLEKRRDQLAWEQGLTDLHHNFIDRKAFAADHLIQAAPSSPLPKPNAMENDQTRRQFLRQLPRQIRSVSDGSDQRWEVGGVWRLEDLPALFDDANFRQAPHEQRKHLLLQVLNSAYDHALTANPHFGRKEYQAL
ncbi:MAG: hypothetical protein U0984_08475, partial [Prosthecobacter sp.]|nr:hypothetical protein [Prosthecobacter sp.]